MYVCNIVFPSSVTRFTWTINWCCVPLSLFLLSRLLIRFMYLCVCVCVTHCSAYIHLHFYTHSNDFSECSTVNSLFLFIHSFTFNCDSHLICNQLFCLYNFVARYTGIFSCWFSSFFSFHPSLNSVCILFTRWVCNSADQRNSIARTNAYNSILAHQHNHHV